MKLCIVDLDGVVANATARFAKAEEAKQEYLADPDSFSDERTATDLYWRTVFDPEYVPLDTLIEGVNDALNTLQEAGYQVIFLTSRPQSMAEATLDWFGLNIFINPGADILFKAPAFQYVKTTVWKAGMVQTLFMLYDAGEMIVVDDEVANLQEIGKWIASPQYLGFTSLAEAVAKLNGTWVEPDPFLPPE